MSPGVKGILGMTACIIWCEEILGIQPVSSGVNRISGTTACIIRCEGDFRDDSLYHLVLRGF